MLRIEQKQQTRERVVEAATRLFAENGLAGTRTADIASRAGLSHGGVFVHFSSREELLSEVVATTGRAITDRLHALVQEDADLPSVLRAHVQCLSEHEASYSVFLRESRLLPPGILRSWVGVQSAIATHMKRPAQKAIDSGAIHKMPLHLMFNTWIGLVHHYLMNQELFTPGGSVLKQHGDKLLAHFISLISRERKYSAKKIRF